MFQDLKPGTYSLWALITTKPKMIPGCTDVLLPKGGWGLGINVGQGRLMTSWKMNTLLFAVLMAENLPADMQPIEIFAVSPAMNIPAGTEKVLDVTLTCK